MTGLTRFLNMNEKIAKKARSTNFSSEEEYFLVMQVEKKKSIIENKKTDAVSWDEKKRAWEDIALQYQLKFGAKREAKSLREKYDNLKKKTRKRLADERREIFQTGGGQCKLKPHNEMEDKLVELIGCTATGFSNSVDTDKVLDEETYFAAMIEEDEEMVNANNHELAAQNGSKSALLEDHSNKILNESIRSVQKGVHDAELGNGNWSSWNPKQLKKKKNEKLTVGEQDRQASTLLDAQCNYFVNEDKRSQEKHDWEREEAVLRLKILETELEIKKKELQKCSSKEENT